MVVVVMVVMMLVVVVVIRIRVTQINIGALLLVITAFIRFMWW